MINDNYKQMIELISNSKTTSLNLFLEDFNNNFDEEYLLNVLKNSISCNENCGFDSCKFKIENLKFLINKFNLNLTKLDDFIIHKLIKDSKTKLDFAEFIIDNLYKNNHKNIDKFIFSMLINNNLKPQDSFKLIRKYDKEIDLTKYIIMYFKNENLNIESLKYLKGNELINYNFEDMNFENILHSLFQNKLIINNIKLVEYIYNNFDFDLNNLRKESGLGQVPLENLKDIYSKDVSVFIFQKHQIKSIIDL